jgi:hypothetical protein
MASANKFAEPVRAKTRSAGFKTSFGYINDVLSINNDQFHSYVDSIYPNELEIKDTTGSSTFASYMDPNVKHRCWRKANNSTV